MESKETCPCLSCEKVRTCNWACEKIDDWAKDKTFAQIADELIKAYKKALPEKGKGRRTA